MAGDITVRRLGDHRNAFGFLRLLFAASVIVSHTPQLIDGNAGREIVTRVFGTIDAGAIAVDGFFIVSGFLITGSFLQHPGLAGYLTKRVARIYPAFIAASLISLLVVAPLGGVSWARLLASRGVVLPLADMLTLQDPRAPGVFAASHFAYLNGPLWTIAYEFRAYLLVVVLGFAGAFRRPWLIAALAAGLLVAHVACPAAVWQRINGSIPFFSFRLIGDSVQDARLMGQFLMGSLFYLLRHRIRFSAHATIAAAVGLCILLFHPALAEIGVATCGAWLIFAAARFGGANVLGRINDRDDISYGLYLYAWPVEKLIILAMPRLSMPATGLLTFAIAALCGWISWHALEKPVLRRVRAGGARPPDPGAVGATDPPR